MVHHTPSSIVYQILPSTGTRGLVGSGRDDPRMAGVRTSGGTESLYRRDFNSGSLGLVLDLENGSRPEEGPR